MTTAIHMPSVWGMLIVLMLAYLLFGRPPGPPPPTGMAPVLRRGAQKREEASIEGRDRHS